MRVQNARHQINPYVEGWLGCDVRGVDEREGIERSRGQGYPDSLVPSAPGSVETGQRGRMQQNIYLRPTGGVHSASYITEPREGREKGPSVDDHRGPRRENQFSRTQEVIRLPAGEY